MPSSTSNTNLHLNFAELFAVLAKVSTTRCNFEPPTNYSDKAAFPIEHWFIGYNPFRLTKT
jgi:hypothetical protein